MKQHPYILAILLTLLLASNGLAQESVLNRARSKLASQRSYSTDFETKVILGPGAPEVTLKGRMMGSRPNNFRMETELKARDTVQSTVVVFDGDWQWVDATATQQKRLLQRKILKINADIARPGNPFDTFYYFSGSGLLPGEDYLGHFKRLLSLYTFGEAKQNGDFLVLEGDLIESRYKEYLAERDQLVMAEILSVDQSMMKCRLYLSPDSYLPLGCDLGESLETPQARLRLRNFQENPNLSKETFTYTIPKGWSVYDATAEVADARFRAQSLKEGSDFFDVISAFMSSDNVLDDELIEALQSRDNETVLKRVRADSALLEQLDGLGNTPFLNAVMARNSDLANALLELGSDPNVHGYSHSTALHFAAQNDDNDLVAALLKAGALVNARNKNGETPLHKAQGEAVIELLLAAGAEEEVSTNFGELPPAVARRGGRLVAAAFDGDKELMERLISRGAKPDVYYQSQFGPRFSALQMGSAKSLDTLKFLLSKWEAKGDARRPVLTDLLTFANDTEILEFLVSQGAEPAKVDLFGSIHGDILSWLIEAGAPVTARNEAGENLLIFHLKQRQDRNLEDIRPFLKTLVKRGVDPNELVEDSKSADDGLGKVGPIHLNVRQLEKLKLLLDAGANADLTTETGWTALHLAATYNEVKSMELLHEKGASLTTQEPNGWTPLHSAVYLNQKRAVDFLLTHQKELDIKDKEGNTALHLAAHMRRAEMVKKLLEAGAKSGLSNSEGELPKDLTTDQEIQRLLRRN